jgi:hypothetical protein
MWQENLYFCRYRADIRYELVAVQMSMHWWRCRFFPPPVFGIQHQPKLKVKPNYQHRWLQQYPLIKPRFRIPDLPGNLSPPPPPSSRSLSYDTSVAVPKRVLHRVPSSAFSFNFQYPSFSLQSSSSCIRLLPRLPVTAILTSLVPSNTCFRRQFLCKMWPIQFAFLLFIVRRIFLS